MTQAPGTPSPPSPRQAVALSVVIPVFNEAGNIVPLLEEIRQALTGHVRFEVIFVNDGSDDDSRTVLGRVVSPQGAEDPVRALCHHRRSGQSAAVRTGARAARGAWIATLDGDGQNDPADIPKLLAVATAPGAGSGTAPALVGGVRTRRRDTLSKRLASRFANGLRQSLLQDGATDTGCGIKLFRREAYLGLPFFAAQHRFLPALFRIHGFATAFAPVNHRPRRQGVSKYGNLGRALVGIVDLLGVWWLKQRTPAATGASEMTTAPEEFASLAGEGERAQ